MEEKARKVPVLILGNGITALGVLRALRRRGIPCLVASDAPGLVKGSRWYRDAAANGRELKAGQLAAWLSESPLERAVLIPCNDEAVLEVASLPADLRARFPASVPPRETAELFIDKALFAEHLRRHGIPHPATVELESASDLDAVTDAQLRSSFLKPKDSQAFCRAFELKALAFTDRTNARSQLEFVLDRGFGLVLQELIPGPADHQLCVDGFVDRDGRMKALFARRWLRKFPADFAEASLAESIPLDEVPEAVEMATSVIASVPHRGAFTVELKWHARDGGYRVLEVNARPGWFVGFIDRAGVDVCSMIYRDALGQEVEELQGYRLGVRVAHPRADIQAWRALPPAVRSSRLRLFLEWATAVKLVFTWSDPGPWGHAFFSRVVARLRRRNPNAFQSAATTEQRTLGSAA